MSNISEWKDTADANNATPPDGWPEGQAPSTVNNCAREMMRAIRLQFQGSQWFNYGPTVTLKSQNKIKISSNSYNTTAIYQVGRRIKVISNDATVYGVIDAVSSSSSARIVEMTPDSGTLTSTITQVNVSIITVTNPAIPVQSNTLFRPSQNLLINGGFRVSQRLGTTAYTAATTPNNNDATWLLDRWCLLSDGNDVVDVQQVANPSGVNAQNYMTSLVATANKKWAYFQIMEAADSAQTGGNNVSLSLQAAYSNVTNLSTLRMGVLEWGGTEDSPTKDCISAWNAAGANPTLAANWTFASVPVDLALTAAFVKYKEEAIAVSAGIKNLAVLIWVDDTDCVAGELLWLTQVKLEINDIATDYDDRPYALELQACQRFFEGNNYATSTTHVGTGMNTGNNVGFGGFFYKTTKRITPTIVDTAAGDFLATQNTGSGQTLSAFSFNYISKETCRLEYTTVNTNLVAGECSPIITKNTAGTIHIDAEFNT